MFWTDLKKLTFRMYTTPGRTHSRVSECRNLPVLIYRELPSASPKSDHPQCREHANTGAQTIFSAWNRGRFRNILRCLVTHAKPFIAATFTDPKSQPQFGIPKTIARVPNLVIFLNDFYCATQMHSAY